MQNENSITPPKAQEQQRINYECELGNSSQSMLEAGQFVWALGALLRNIHAHDVEAVLLTPPVLDGLCAGLSLIGSKLSDDGEACRDLVRRNGAYAQGGAL